MKKKILVTVLIILMYMILVSCNSYTSSSAQGNRDSLMQYSMAKGENYDQDTVKIVKSDSIIVIKKEISKKMEVDTNVKIKSQNYEKLEKTQMEIKQQQRILDSMIVVKKK